MTSEQEAKLREIAQKMGISLDDLLKQGTPEFILESYANNKLQILNE